MIPARTVRQFQQTLVPLNPGVDSRLSRTRIQFFCRSLPGPMPLLTTRVTHVVRYVHVTSLFCTGFATPGRRWPGRRPLAFSGRPGGRPRRITPRLQPHHGPKLRKTRRSTRHTGRVAPAVAQPAHLTQQQQRLHTPDPVFDALVTFGRLGRLVALLHVHSDLGKMTRATARRRGQPHPLQKRLHLAAPCK